jgi:hypothetical protein
MLLLKIAFAVLGLAVSTIALAADAGDRRFITTGMSEGEVMMKIGKPDSVSEDTGGGAKEAIKRWVYFPTTGDSQTITTIVMKKGKVEEVERKVAR